MHRTPQPGGAEGAVQFTVLAGQEKIHFISSINA